MFAILSTKMGKKRLKNHHFGPILETNDIIIPAVITASTQKLAFELSFGVYINTQKIYIA